MFRECTHIKTNGIKCHSPAMRGTSLCFYHARARRRAPASKTSKDLPFDLPDLIEPGMIEIAIHEVLSALASGRISPRRAGVLLHGLQLADQKLSERPLEDMNSPPFQPLPPLTPICAPCVPSQSIPHTGIATSVIRVRAKKKPPEVPGASGVSDRVSC
jgi:hypothetical protein